MTAEDFKNLSMVFGRMAATAQSGAAVAAPVQPVAAPVQPVAAPVQPVAAPVQPVAAPVQYGSAAAAPAQAALTGLASAGVAVPPAVQSDQVLMQMLTNIFGQDGQTATQAAVQPVVTDGRGGALWQ